MENLPKFTLTKQSYEFYDVGIALEKICLLNLLME